jgi:hypothetical protein
MDVYLTREFARFASKAGLASAALCRAATDLEAGRYQASLGGGVFKQRIAREGAGKSGGYRAILFFKRGERVFFAHGFAKNDKANVSPSELRALKRLADVMLGLNKADLAKALAGGELMQLECDDDR